MLLPYKNQNSLRILLRIIYFRTEIAYTMKKIGRKYKRSLQMREVEQVGLLVRQPGYTSFPPLKNYLQEQKIDEIQRNRMDNSKVKQSNKWWNICYLVGLGILMIILILDIGVQIGMEHARRTNFVDNLNRMNMKGIMEKPSIPIVQQNQERPQIDSSSMPDFFKVSDIILRQHAKQKLTQNNLLKDNQINVPTDRYAYQNPQPSLNLKVNTNLLVRSFPFIPQNMNPHVVTPNPDFNQEYSMVPNSAAPQIPQFQLPQTHRRQVISSQQRSSSYHEIQQISSDQRLNASKWKNLVNQDYTVDTELAKSERQYYQNKYNILQYNELPFCIVVPTFNNTQNNRYLNNIRSIVMQEYKNFHIVVIDDGSSDNTGQLIDNFMKQQTKISLEKYTLITNTVQKKALPNLRMAAMEYCQPDQIFLIVDGDDQLLGRQVLRFFNAAFQKNQAWFVYSNFLGSNGGIGYSRPFPKNVIKQNSYRSFPYVTSHLRAFYTKLFRNIKEQDLKDQNGQYFYAANDVAVCIPILEMAHKKVVYIPELTYYYNSNTGLNNHIVRLQEQKANDRKVRGKQPYAELSELKFDQ